MAATDTRLALRAAPAQPAGPLTERQARRTMRLSVLEGMPATVFINWTAGSVLTGYALHLGATPGELGLIASAPLLGQATSPLAAWLAGRMGARKPLAIAAALLGRALWLLAALLPAVAPPGSRVGLLVLVILLSSVGLAANGTLWTAWMGDVVPPRERGRYFGFRSGVLGAVGTGANLVAGAVLDALASPMDFQVVLAVAVASGLLAGAMLWWHDEPPAPAGRLPLVGTFVAPVRDANFRRFLAFAVYWSFAVLLAGPFVIPYFLGQLRMSFTQVAAWSAIASLSALVLSPLWGRVADRYGNRPVLKLTTFGAGTVLPLGWMLASPGVLWPVWLSAVADAVVWGAIGPAQFNLALASAPRENRASYVAVLSAATGVAGFIGGLTSGQLFELYRRLELPELWAGWTPYHWLFLTSALLRTQAWRLVSRVREDDAWRARDLLLAWRRR